MHTTVRHHNAGSRVSPVGWSSPGSPDPGTGCFDVPSQLIVKSASRRIGFAVLLAMMLMWAVMVGHDASVLVATTGQASEGYAPRDRTEPCPSEATPDVERCNNREVPYQDENARFSQLGLEQAELLGDVDIVREYGKRHPEGWAGLGFDNGSPVKIVACFSRDIELHRDQLASLVAHPDKLDIRVVRHSERELEALRAEIEPLVLDYSRRVGGSATIGNGLAVIHVGLPPGADEFGHALRDRYGDTVEVKVGTVLRTVPGGVPPNTGRPA